MKIDKILFKRGKKPHKSTDLDESVRLVPLCGTFQKNFRGPPGRENFFEGTT